MGRPSLADVRRPQLLDAYADCLVRYGAEGTTLERVAETAGVTRGLVRHYLGNREEVLRALGEHVRDRYLEWLDEGSTEPGGTLDGLIDRLLSEQPPELYAVIDALFVEAPKDPRIAEVLRQIYEAFEQHVERAVARAMPRSSEAARRQIALAMVSFGFADTDFQTIGFAHHRRSDYRAIVLQLIEGSR